MDTCNDARSSEESTEENANTEEGEEPANILIDLLDSFASRTDSESRFCEAGTNTDLSFFTYLDRQVQELVIYK